MLGGKNMKKENTLICDHCGNFFDDEELDEVEFIEKTPFHSSCMFDIEEERNSKHAESIIL